MILVKKIWANRLLFVSKRTNEQFAQKIEWFARLLIYHEWPKRIAHSCSFFMSDLSDSLTVAHLSLANHSQLLIWSERSEGMSDKGILNPGQNIKQYSFFLLVQ